MTGLSRQNRRHFLAGAAATVAATSVPLPIASGGQARASGGRAPQWDISEWINGDAGNIDTLKGKVIVIDFFQLWCPGCNKFSGPLMKHWHQKFAADVDAGRLVLVKIHTVFEGHSHQTVTRLKRYVREKNITIPVGVDRHQPGQRIPETMRRYNTRGTPEMVVIDPDGMIRFQKFGYFEPGKVEPMIVEMFGKDRA